ncbi:hypothetical protein Golomagni_05823 [Golovinomyces magnicellulatus]|nr:hypothetical protein Golomagni_05823 [Golovinomyces magnicellulatus]
MRAPTLCRVGTSIFSQFLRRGYSTETSNILTIDINAPNAGKVRVISLVCDPGAMNRGPARNAISRQFLKDLRQAIDRIHSEYDLHEKELPTPSKRSPLSRSGPTTRALIIASEVDSCFCTGADSIEHENFTPEEASSFGAELRSTFNSISNLPIPSISAVSSIAFGHGLELALCTNLRVLTSNAEVGLPEIRHGTIPSAGGTLRLPALIGKSRAQDLILTGRKVSGQEALSLGLANRLLDVTPHENESNSKFMSRVKEEVLQAAIILAFEICEGGPLAIFGALNAIDSDSEEIENQIYERLTKTNDRIEGLLALKEKRKPLFTGR